MEQNQQEYTVTFNCIPGKDTEQTQKKESEVAGLLALHATDVNETIRGGMAELKFENNGVLSLRLVCTEEELSYYKKEGGQRGNFQLWIKANILDPSLAALVQT